MAETLEPLRPLTTADQITKSLSHHVRIDILMVLHEGPASQKEIAGHLHEPLSNITHHINELRKAKAIEVAFTKKVGNVNQHYWRAIRSSTYYTEDLAKLDPEEHEGLRRIITQSMVAELLAAFRAGRLTDPRATTAWDRIWLDEQGFTELAEFADDYFGRMYEIAAAAAERVSRTGEEPRAYTVGVMAFGRSRSTPNVKATVGHVGMDPPDG